MKFEWELIHEEVIERSMQSTYRAKVIGGWVLRIESLVDDEREKQLDGWSNVSNSMTFIPDTHHEWTIDQ